MMKIILPDSFRTNTNVALSGAALAGLLAVSWWLTITMSADFYALADSRVSWHHASFNTLLLMWAVMMAAMMLPAAIPFLNMFAKCAPVQNAPPFATAAAAGGYLACWLLFSLVAASLQVIATPVLNETMFLQEPFARAVLFAIAGTYQLTPLKFACLRGCRPPALFLLLHWRRGVGGAFVTGAHNGMFCVGCCWALMLLLFAGGIMDVRWIVALTVYAIAEKITPAPVMLARTAGILLLMLAGAEISGQF